MISSRWPRPIGIMRVDRLDPGLQRLLHRLALDDAGRDALDRHRDRWSAIGPLPSMRLAERVDDAADAALRRRAPA